MESIGFRTRKILTRAGEVTTRRRYYRCIHCGNREFPYDDMIGISGSQLSKQCALSSMWLSIFMPFEHAKDFMRYVLNVEISETCLKETSYRIGAKLYQDMMRAGRRPETMERPSENVGKMYIQADGSMAPIRGEEKREFKEVKLGLVYTEGDIVHKMKRNGDMRTEIKNKRFVGSIGEGVEPFKKMLHARAIEKGYYQASEVVLLSDGASWIDKMHEGYFPKAVHILDWYHVMEHLWETSKKLFGEIKIDECESWIKPLKEKLWEGKVDEVIKSLEQEGLKRTKKQKPLFELRGYFVSNRHKMKYNEYREKGYYIGSGAIESAHKYVISNRMKMAGMRWSLSHANSMVWLRCLFFEDRWQSFWEEMEMKDYLKDPGRTHPKAA